MEWTDEGTIIGARQHGESSVILEVMTHVHGRHLGLVRHRDVALGPCRQAQGVGRREIAIELDPHPAIPRVTPS